jgi:uncharacterized protein YkwD
MLVSGHPACPVTLAARRSSTTMACVLVALVGACSAAGERDREVSADDDTPVEELDPFAAAFVDAHNAARADVSPAPSTPLPPVVWNTGIGEVAQAWADRCVFEHSSGNLGENLALFSSSSTTPTDVVDAWVAEVADYDYDTNRCAANRACGHYTQVVWRDSTRIGCAKTSCANVGGFGAGTLWVCNYDPPGNFVGERPY